MVAAARPPPIFTFCARVVQLAHDGTVPEPRPSAARCPAPRSRRCPASAPRRCTPPPRGTTCSAPAPCVLLRCTTTCCPAAVIPIANRWGPVSGLVFSCQPELPVGPDLAMICPSSRGLADRVDPGAPASRSPSTAARAGLPSIDVGLLDPLNASPLPYLPAGPRGASERARRIPLPGGVRGRRSRCLAETVGGHRRSSAAVNAGVVALATSRVRAQVHRRIRRPDAIAVAGRSPSDPCRVNASRRRGDLREAAAARSLAALQQIAGHRHVVASTAGQLRLIWLLLTHRCRRRPLVPSAPACPAQPGRGARHARVAAQVPRRIRRPDAVAVAGRAVRPVSLKDVTRRRRDLREAGAARTLAPLQADSRDPDVVRRGRPAQIDLGAADDRRSPAAPGAVGACVSGHAPPAQRRVHVRLDLSLAKGRGCRARTSSMSPAKWNPLLPVRRPMFTY